MFSVNSILNTPTSRNLQLFKIYLNHKPQLEKEADVSSMRETINDLISAPNTRNEGLFVVDSITKSNQSVYIHNWGPIIISILKCPDNHTALELALSILNQVVVNFSRSTNFSEAFQAHISQIVPLLLKIGWSNEGASSSCKSLAVCMQYLPAVVGHFSDDIEEFLMKFAASVDFKMEEAIADCFTAFPACVQSRQKSKSPYVDSWLDVFLKIFNTLQALLNDIFKDCSAENFFVQVVGLSLLPMSYDEEEKEEHSYVFKRIKIFSALCKSLSKMMSVHMDSSLENLKVHVPVLDLLKFLQRVFLVTDLIKGNQIPENSVISVTYPIMHIAALSVLESLIVNFTIIEQSGNFVTILNKIVLTTVMESPQSWTWHVRSSTWKVASTWLKFYGPKSSCEIVRNRLLISELIKDITLEQENSQAAATEILGTDNSRGECCAEALHVLYSMFIFGGAFMCKDFKKEIFSAVLKTCVKVQQSLHPAKKFVHPYTNNKCRLNLYKCLVQAAVSDPLQTKFVKQAINVIRFGTKDPYLEVTTVCHKSLNLFRFYIHSKKPLPETMTSASRLQQAPPPQEESEQTGWESGFDWNIPNESSREERSMDASPPLCQIDAAYHNSVGSDGRREASPIHYSEAMDAQCNGSSQKHPSHSSACHDSGSEEVKGYDIEEADDSPALCGAPLIETLKPEPSSRPHFVELKPARVISEEANHQEPDAVDLEDDDEEAESPHRMAENGVYPESEEEEEEDVDDVSGSEDEEGSEPDGYVPPYAANRYSPVSDHDEQEEEENEPTAAEYSPEKKRQKMNDAEEEHSSGEEEYYEPPSNHQNQELAAAVKVEGEDINPQAIPVPSSPTVDEMCRDFVLAEPDEIMR